MSSNETPIESRNAWIAVLVFAFAALTLFVVHEIHETKVRLQEMAEQQEVLRLKAEQAARIEQEKYEEHVRHALQIRVKYPDADPDTIIKALQAAEKYQFEDFPRAQDIITIVGIESSWRPAVCSNLPSDPACGLTQVRPALWKEVVGDDDIRDIDTQIRAGAEILHRYYISLNKSKSGAILSYNNGITAYVNGQYTKDYLYKFWREVAYVQKKVFA